MIAGLATIVVLLFVIRAIPVRRPWDRTRVLTPRERVSLYTARRGAIEDDPWITTRHVRGMHLRGLYAVDGKLITNPARMLPAPNEEDL